MNRPLVQANISWLTDTLATGGDLSRLAHHKRDQVLDLLQQRITHIFDARIEDDDTTLWLLKGVNYMNVGTDDRAGHHIPARVFDQAVMFAREAEAAGGRMLAHCHMGINRGPSMAAAILMDRGMDPLDVLRLIKDKRPQAGLYYFLDAYDAHVAREGATPDPDARRAAAREYYQLFRSAGAKQHTMRAITEGHEADRQARRAMDRVSY